MTTRDTRDEQLSDEEFDRIVWFVPHDAYLVEEGSFRARRVFPFKALTADRRALKDEIKTLREKALSTLGDASRLLDEKIAERERADAAVERAEWAERALARAMEHLTFNGWLNDPGSDRRFAAVQELRALSAHVKEGEDV